MVFAPSRLAAVAHRVLTVTLGLVVLIYAAMSIFILVTQPPWFEVGDVRVSDPSTAHLVVFVVLFGAFGALLVIGLQQLRGLVGSVHEGDPFVDVNVRRIRILAALFVTRPLAEFAFSVVASQFGGSGPVSLGIPVESILGGLCLLVLAEVFAHGVRMREDLEGTV